MLRVRRIESGQLHEDGKQALDINKPWAKLKFQIHMGLTWTRVLSTGFWSTPYPIYMSGYVLCPNLEAADVFRNNLKYPNKC